MNSTIGRVLAAAAIFACATDAAAQDRSTGRGLLLGAHVNSSSIQIDEDGGGEAETGLGLGAIVGYGFSESLALFLRADAAAIEYSDDSGETYSLGNVDLGLRYLFGTPAQPLRPYAELALSGIGVVAEVEAGLGTPVEVTMGGGALVVGAGIEYFFGRKTSLDVGLALGKGRITSFEVDGESVPDMDDFDVTTVRIDLGVRVRL
jgi:hypothetical protein